MCLNEVSNVGSIADKGRSLEICNFLGESILDDAPDIAAWYGCVAGFVSEGGNGDR